MHSLCETAAGRERERGGGGREEGGKQKKDEEYSISLNGIFYISLLQEVQPKVLDRRVGQSQPVGAGRSDSSRY